MSAARPASGIAADGDCKALMDASAALDVREVDFFRLAFRRWFGRDIVAADLERGFAAYMFDNVVPPWARHFSRLVLADAAAGRLDPVRLGAMAYRRQPPAPRHGAVYVGATLAVFLFYCVSLTLVRDDALTSAPLPCYGGPGFQFAAAVAHAFSGTPPPACPRFGAPR